MSYICQMAKNGFYCPVALLKQVQTMIMMMMTTEVTSSSNMY